MPNGLLFIGEENVGHPEFINVRAVNVGQAVGPRYVSRFAPG